MADGTNNPTDAQNAWVKNTFGVDPNKRANGGSDAGRASGAHDDTPAVMFKDNVGGKNSNSELMKKLRAKTINLEPISQEELDALSIDERIEITKLGQQGLTANTSYVATAKRLEPLMVDSSFPEQAPLRAALKLQTQIKADLASGHYDNVLALLPEFDGYVNALQSIRADRPEQEKIAKKTAGQVAKMSDERLDHLSVEEKSHLLLGLLAAGQPKGEALVAQKRIYKHTGLDPAFERIDQAQERKVAAALKGNRELEAARRDWGSLDVAAKLKAFKQLADTQCKVYGIPPLEVVQSDPKDEMAGHGIIETAHFDPSDKKIHVNFSHQGVTGNFDDSVESIFHEAAHFFQETLVDKYTSGELKPGDPLYSQARLFAANNIAPGGNFTPKNAAEVEDYKNQPKERHSFKTSKEMAKATLQVL